ncbi:MAG: hypothetical protein AB7I01_23835 [Gammaproteobacteria bacterium]
MKKTFALPAVLAASSFAALLLALLDDGLFDYVAAAVLVLPLATLPWALIRARRGDD